jgi:hypothetical protein
MNNNNFIFNQFISWYQNNSYILSQPPTITQSQSQQFIVYFYVLDRITFGGNILLQDIVTHYIGTVNGLNIYMKIHKNEIYFIIPRNDNGDLLSDHFTFKIDKWNGNGFDYIPFHKTIQNKTIQQADKIHAWFQEHIVIDLNNIGNLNCFYGPRRIQFKLSDKFSGNDLNIIENIIKTPLSRNYVGGAQPLKIDPIELKINDLLKQFIIKNNDVDNIKLSVIVDDNILHISIFFDEKNITKNYYEQYKLIK